MTTRPRIRVVLLALALSAAALPAFAQNDLSGEWIPVQEEDNTGNVNVGAGL